VFAEAVYLIVGWLGWQYHSQISGAVQNYTGLPSEVSLIVGVLLIAAVALIPGVFAARAIKHVPGLGMADRVAGSVAHVVLVGLVFYGGLALLANSDHLRAALLGLPSVMPVDVFRAIPGASDMGFVRDLGPRQIDISRLQQLLLWYQRQLRPLLLGSRLAPILFQLYAHLPVIGTSAPYPA
jgi:hypothetical protein